MSAEDKERKSEGFQAPQEKTYYTILGVEPSSQEPEIRAAYLKLSMHFHPDKNDGSFEANERFKEISEANEVLKNPEKRKQYDFHRLVISGDITKNIDFLANCIKENAIKCAARPEADILFRSRADDANIFCKIIGLECRYFDEIYRALQNYNCREKDKQVTGNALFGGYNPFYYLVKSLPDKSHENGDALGKLMMLELVGGFAKNKTTSQMLKEGIYIALEEEFKQTQSMATIVTRLEHFLFKLEHPGFTTNTNLFALAAEVVGQYLDQINLELSAQSSGATSVPMQHTGSSTSHSSSSSQQGPFDFPSRSSMPQSDSFSSPTQSASPQDPEETLGGKKQKFSECLRDRKSVKRNIQFLADCIEEDARTYCTITGGDSSNIFYMIIQASLDQVKQIFEALSNYNSRQVPGAKINNADIVFGGNNPFFPLLIFLKDKFKQVTEKLIILKEFAGENYQSLLLAGIEMAKKANPRERYLLALKNYVSYLVDHCGKRGKELSVEIMVFSLAMSGSNLDSKPPSQEGVKRKESPSAFPDSQAKKIPRPEIGCPVSLPSMPDVDPIEKNKKKFFEYSNDVKSIKKNIKFLTNCIEKDAKTYCAPLDGGSCNIFCNIVIMPWPQFNEIFDALRRYKLRQEPSSIINNVDVIFGGKNPFYYLFALSYMNEFDVTIKKIKVLKEFTGDKYQSLLLAGVEEANKDKREGIYISTLERYLSNLEKYPELSIEVGVFRQAITRINLDSNLRSLRPEEFLRKKRARFLECMESQKKIMENIGFLAKCIEEDARNYCSINFKGNIFCKVLHMKPEYFNQIFNALKKYNSNNPSSRIDTADVIFRKQFHLLFRNLNKLFFPDIAEKSSVFKEILGENYQPCLMAGIQTSLNLPEKPLNVAQLKDYLSYLLGMAKMKEDVAVEIAVIRQVLAERNLNFTQQSSSSSSSSSHFSSPQPQDQMGQAHDFDVKFGHAEFEKKSKRKQPGSETPSSSSSSASSSNVTDQFVKRKREAPLNKPASFFQSASPSQPQFKQPNLPLGASPFASSSSGFFPQASPQPKCKQSEPSSLDVTFGLWVKAVENLLNETFPFNPDGDNSKRNFYFGKYLGVVNSPVLSNINELKKIYEKLALEKAQQSSLPASVPDYKGPH